jgi:hypothetical protein
LQPKLYTTTPLAQSAFHFSKRAKVVTILLLFIRSFFFIITKTKCCNYHISLNVIFDFFFLPFTFEINKFIIFNSVSQIF